MRTVVHRLGVRAFLLAIAGTLAGMAAVVPMHASAAGVGKTLLTVLPVGTVLQQTNAVLPADLRPLATGKRVTYISTNMQNEKIPVTGLVITPKVQSPQANVVAWAHGTTGLGDQCTPSTNADVFWPEAVMAVKSYMQKGWTVTATDYPGLGTTLPHPYLVGEGEARSIIDSVRAARKLNSDLTNKWVVSGHSQGGQAALFTGEIAGSYGNGLQLKGVVAMAPASNLDTIAQGIVGTPGQGLLVAGLLGLAAANTGVDPNTLLAQPAKDRLDVFETGCYYEILDAYASLTPAELLVDGILPQAIVDLFAQYGNPAQQASTAPILVTHGTADPVVPVEITYLLQAQACAYTAPVFLQTVEGADHEGAVLQTLNDVAAYIQARFAGSSAPDNC